MPRYTQSCLACDWCGDIFVRPYENPPCPSCGDKTERSWTGDAVAINRDELPGGQWFENGFSEPRKFYSKSEHLRALAAEGCEVRAKWVPGDKYLTRWDTVDLDAAKTLLERGPQARREKAARWPQASIPIATTDGGTFRERDL